MIKNIILITLIAFSCNSKPADTNQNETVSKRLSLEEFNQVIKNENVQLVDVRTPEEYSRGFIDGAVNIDFQSAEFLKTCESQLDKAKPLAVYCAAGGRSSKAMAQLKAAGFTEIYELGVGYNGYK
ncbi:rhodanese-like domain-containing protein [Fulvivirga lutea]|uniref:Rhodanese-like domain-containing protein n=1 Tax=Fulvivirga lutea TaxID=2810512 RepID=A0A974WEQ8_9BACT|nr:rhodanese-like domain-containing protein [Fulvivirga lutea]QSE96525.1 rhodanese-like domain-containing protein [Fulvivirga lutea]